MPRLALVALVVLLSPASGAAQWRGYTPDSADYRLVMRAGSPSGSIGRITFTHAAALTTRVRGDDSLTVRVTMLVSENSFGDGNVQTDSSRSAPMEIPISRWGMDATPAGGLPDVAVGPEIFARLFVGMAFPRRDSLGQLVRSESDADSMARIGLHATTSRTTLPDTVVGGVSISREAMEMSMQTDSSISPRPGVPPMPPMRMYVRAEQWIDPAFRVIRSTGRTESRPLAGGGASDPVFGGGMDLQMDFERLPRGSG